MEKGQVIDLGDGVLIEFTGHDFRLFTSDDCNEIFLDEDIAANLFETLREALGD